MLIAVFFPDYWYLSFIALIPFLGKIVNAAPRAAFRLGFFFGATFFSVSLAESFLSAPFLTLVQLAFGVTLFAVFGWGVGWIKERWGFNPLFIAALWVGFELALMKMGFARGLLDAPVLALASPFFHGLAILFGSLVISFVVVLFNSLLVLAVEKVLLLIKARPAVVPESDEIWSFSPGHSFLAQKVYLVPAGRAPPVFPILGV